MSDIQVKLSREEAYALTRREVFGLKLQAKNRAIEKLHAALNQEAECPVAPDPGQVERAVRSAIEQHRDRLNDEMLEADRKAVLEGDCLWAKLRDRKAAGCDALQEILDDDLPLAAASTDGQVTVDRDEVRLLLEWHEHAFGHRAPDSALATRLRAALDGGQNAASLGKDGE